MKMKTSLGNNPKYYLVYMLILVKLNNAYLNFYLSSTELQKLLGLDAELYYVRDGVVNNYALNFVMQIPPTLNTLHFTWESLTSQTLPYFIAIQTNSSSLSLPKLNISSTGLIPHSPQVFSISLNCLETVNDEVDVIITINITISRNNITQLILRRKKFCIKLEKKSDNQELIKNTIPSNSSSINIIYIALCCLLTIIAIIISVFAMQYVKQKKNESERNDDQDLTFLAAAPTNLNSNSYGSFRRVPSSSLSNEKSKDLQERIAELTVQRCRVKLSNVILEGTFSRIYKGLYTNENDIEETVIIKTVTDHASQVQISLLLQEGMSMYSINHKNILSIYRVSIEDRTAPFLLYQFNGNINLKIFLQKCKISPEGVSHTLTTQEVVDMAIQILEGLHYLHKKRLLHKDLATRNCVVNDELQVKVADNALSRDLFPSDYHCLGDNENRSIKWLAIESLLEKNFSTSSDVWSFGVLLWELTTLAQQPYAEIDPFEMAAYLKDGYRLAQPINCPDELFAVMAYCWAMSVEERPTVSQLKLCLQDFHAQLSRYV